jgi:hypothetical protein
MQNFLIELTRFWTNNAKKEMEFFNVYRFISILG